MTSSWQPSIPVPAHIAALVEASISLRSDVTGYGFDRVAIVTIVYHCRRALVLARLKETARSHLHETPKSPKLVRNCWRRTMLGANLIGVGPDLWGRQFLFPSAV